MTGRKALLRCFLLVSLTAAVHGQAAPEGKKAPDFSQEAVVVEQLATKIVFQADGTSITDSTTRVRMQSEAGVQQFGILNIPYAKANGEVEIVYARVRKPDGSVVTTPEENVQEMPAEITREAPFYSDLREKHVTVRGLAVGDTLEFHIRSVLSKPQVPGQFWYDHSFQKDVITKEETLEIRFPKDKYVKVKSPEVKPSEREEGGYRVYSWKTANLEVKPKETKKRQQRASQGEAPAPSVELTTFRDWEEIAKWYDGLQRERIAATPEIRAKALEITKGLTDQDAKLQALYHYVGTQFRYVGLAFGIGRYQPHAASDVLANGYGDCKDKHTLLAALANAVGIQVVPALVNASRKLDPDVPSLSQFNHMISVAPEGNKLVWLDTTAEVAPYGLLLSNVRDKQALVIFSGKPAALMNTPADPPFPSLIRFETVGKLGGDGVLHARITREIRGDLEVLLRLAYRRTPRPRWQELTQQVSYMSNFAGEVSNIDVSDPDDTSKPFHIAYDYVRKDYPDWRNQRINPPIPPMLGSVADDDKWSEDEFLGAPGQFIYRAKIELPKGYNAFKAASVEVKSEFANYQADYDTSTPGTLIVERRLTILHGKIKESEWNKYRNFSKEVASDRDRMLDVYIGDLPGLEKRDRGAGTGPADDEHSAEARHLLEQATQALMAKNFITAGDYLQQLTALDPKYPGAWAAMGTLAAMQNRPDDAIESFQKELTYHPDNKEVCRRLARYQFYLKRRKDAVETWRKFVKANPDDEEGLRTLGQVLVEDKEYTEAAGYLERAEKNDPDNATVQLLLGTAYLETGQHDQAIAKFEKATTLDPSANMLNNVGYSLADSPADLPKALEYGKKAVAAVEEESRQATLSELKMSDLNRMGHLSAYWDTLGWSYFKANESDKAEAYLKAAWMLSQSGVEGDHLAQVYEKKGDMAAAAHLYELAVSRGAEPEAKQRLERARAKAPASKPQALTKAGKPALASPANPGEELSRLRTTKVGAVPGVKNGSAEFFILLRDGGTVEAVKFISGNEELKSAEKAIQAAHFDQPLPPGSQAKIIRRGFLSCSEYTKGCDFVVMPLETVRSLE